MLYPGILFEGGGGGTGTVTARGDPVNHGSKSEGEELDLQANPVEDPAEANPEVLTTVTECSAIMIQCLVNQSYQSVTNLFFFLYLVLLQIKENIACI